MCDLIRGQQIEELSGVFFSVCLMVLVQFWLAVPLTQNFLGISQLDSDSSVTASMASSWPKTQFFHRSISLERTKEKHLHHLDVCACAEIAKICCSSCYFNVVDSLETIQIDYVSEC